MDGRAGRDMEDERVIFYREQESPTLTGKIGKHFLKLREEALVLRVCVSIIYSERSLRT